MSRASFKYCFVLSCLNSSKKNPDKYYFRVPYNKVIRDKWCLAVDRAASSIKQSSTAYCCSDHFDMEEDLDRLASSSGAPKLKEGVVPSLKHNDTQARNSKAMEVIDIFGADLLASETNTKNEQPSSEGVYIREVVYIEENDNDQFLQENVESEMDCLNVGPEGEEENYLTKAVVEISDDKNLLVAVASAIKTLKPSERCVREKTPPKNIVSEQKAICKYKNVKAVAPSNKKPQTFIKIDMNQSNDMLKQNKTTVALNTQEIQPKAIMKWNNTKVLTKSAKQNHFTFQYSEPINENDKYTLKPISAYKIKKGQNASVQPLGNPVTATAPKKNVNQLKYLSLKDVEKLKSQKIEKSLRTPPNDDDCILLDEPSVASNNKTFSTNNQNESDRMLKKIPSCISVKESTRGQTIAPANANAIVRAQPALRVREFGKINHTPDDNHDKEFKIIQLIISENPLLLKSNTSNRIKISRTKPNEFKIFENIYYYRTNKIFEKNYFFMNITQHSRYFNEIIQRNYGIYWGYPRVSCVGIVETKGVLDEETKNFVFQQVKKSLFDADGQQHLKMVNVVHPVQLLRPSSTPTNIPVTVKSEILPANEASETVNVNNEDKLKSDANSVNGLTNFTVGVCRPSSRSALIQPNMKSTMSNQFTSNVSNTMQAPQYESIFRLYKHLNPAMIKLINKMKYFEMCNGFVYAVSIDPKSSRVKDNPFNISFTKNHSRSIVTPVSKELYVSKLVNDIFKAYYQSATEVSTQPKDDPKSKSLNLVSSNGAPLSANVSKPKKRSSKQIEKIRQRSKAPQILKTPNSEKSMVLTSGHVVKIAKVKQDTKNSSTIKPLGIPSSINTPVPIPPLLKISNITQQPPAQIVASAKKPPIASVTSSDGQRVDGSDKVISKRSTPLPTSQIVNSVNSKNCKNKKKHICSYCSETFERSYQLKRHQFVKHNLDKTSNVILKTTDESSNMALNYIHQAIPVLLQNTQPIIKTEKDDETALNEKSLLVPLFELPNKGAKKELQNCPDNLLLVKCKEEPEENIEEITEMPVLLDHITAPPKKRAKKRKAVQNKLKEDTDSAPESPPISTKNFAKTFIQKGRKRTKKILRLSTNGRNQETKKRKSIAKRSKFLAEKIKMSPKKASVIPVKMYEAQEFMKDWPNLTINLVDLSCLEK